MSTKTPFRLIGEGETDPAIEEDKTMVLTILNDILEKVGEEDIRSFVFVGIADNGDIVHGRHVVGNYNAILGALSRAQCIVNRLMDEGQNSTYTEY